MTKKRGALSGFGYLPPGGTPGQILFKKSDIDGDAEWGGYEVIGNEDPDDVVRGQFPSGYLKRYTDNDGDGTPVDDAFDAMLNSGVSLCVVQKPDSSWRLDREHVVPPGVSVVGEYSFCNIDFYGSGWCLDFRGFEYGSFAVCEGLRINLKTAQSNGIRLWECRTVTLRDGFVYGLVNDVITGNVGVELNGGDDKSSTWGTAFCNVENSMMIQGCQTNLRMYTDNTSTPSKNTAFCNRNYIGMVHLQGGGTGLYIDRANTNVLFCCPQGNDRGSYIGSFAKNNVFNLESENNWVDEALPKQIVLHPSADDNLFGGNTRLEMFVNEDGSQARIHQTIKVIGTDTFLIPDIVTLSRTGTMELENPLSSASSATMAILPADDVNQVLSLAQKDTSNNQINLIRLIPGATPYSEVAASTVMRIGAGARVYFATADTTTTAGASAEYIMVQVNGVERRILTRAIS